MQDILLGFIPGGTELMVVLFIVLLLFGGKKLPELMRGMGKGVKEFNAARDKVDKIEKDSNKQIKDKS